jgi:hypothetical protein
MFSEKDIDSAIKQYDSIALRKMAQQAPKEETQLFLNLLADFVDRAVNKLQKTAC